MKNVFNHTKFIYNRTRAKYHVKEHPKPFIKKSVFYKHVYKIIKNTKHDKQMRRKTFTNERLRAYFGILGIAIV